MKATDKQPTFLVNATLINSKTNTIMQTIKVTLPSATAATDTINFQIGGTIIATVNPDVFNKGRYCGNFGAFGRCNNVDAPTACEFVCDAIVNHFAAYGLNVEFAYA